MCDPTYLAWCTQQHQVGVHGVAPAFVSEGWRGVVATEHLEPGHVVMTVPQHLLLSGVSARRDPQLSVLLEQHQLNSHQVLVLHLLHEASKGPASFWHPYISQLPRSYTTCLCWDSSAVEALQVPYAQAAAASAGAQARQEWTSARPVLQRLGVAKKWCSWRAWQWAASTVLSRTMYHPADPECGCLTPLGDLHNYAPPPAPHTPDLEQDMQQLVRGNTGKHQQQQQQPKEQMAGSQRDAAGQLACTCGGVEGGVQACCSCSSQQSSLLPAVAGAALACSGSCCSCACHMHTHAQHAGDMPLSTCSCELAQHSSDNPQLAHACDHGGGGGGSEGPNNNSSSSRPHHEPLGAVTCTSKTPAYADTGGGEVTEPAAAAAGTVEEAGGSIAATGEGAGGSISGDGVFDESEGVYKIVARRRYKPGEQVFLCYGRHTQLELLELYGFMTACNPHDTALLPVEVLQQQLAAAAATHRAQQLQQQHVQGSRHHKRQQHQQHQQGVQLDVAAADCWVHANGQPSWQLLSALRCAAAGAVGCASLAGKARCGEPVSLHCEVLVLQALAATCRWQLAALPTSRDEDLQLLQQQQQEQEQEQQEQEDHKEQQAACLHLALQWRCAYKSILHASISICEALLHTSAKA